MLVRTLTPTLLTRPGVIGVLTAAKLLGGAADITRFRRVADNAPTARGSASDRCRSRRTLTAWARCPSSSENARHEPDRRIR